MVIDYIKLNLQYLSQSNCNNDKYCYTCFKRTLLCNCTLVQWI